MNVIFTRNNTCLSRFIRWVSGEEVSHMAIVFDDKILFQSNLVGCHIAWLGTFLHKNEIIYDLEYEMDLLNEEQVYQSIISSFDGKDYDYLALLYFAWAGLMNRIFGIPLPQKNKWGSKDRFLCTELVQALPVPLKIEDDVDLMTPYKVYLELKKRSSNG